MNHNELENRVSPPGLDMRIFQRGEWDRFQGNVSLKSRTRIQDIEGIVQARAKGRYLAETSGYIESRVKVVTTIISELSRNILLYAGQGDIVLALIDKPPQKGICITAVDQGPGIANVQKALMDGYSSSGGLGEGLPGVRQMADEFNISSSPNEGTRVTVSIWP